MKKILSLVLAAAMVLSMFSISAFAAYGSVGFDKAAPQIGNSFLSEDIGSDTNEIRADWTNSRGLDGEGVATFVNIGTEENVNVAVEAKGNMYANGDIPYGGNMKAYVDLKSVEDAGFCGIILDQTSGLGSGADLTTFNSCVGVLDNGNTMATITGYGFTLRENNKLEVFVNDYRAFDWTDAAQVDLTDFGIDTSNWNTYAIYRTTDQKAYVTVNNILVAVIDCAGNQLLDATGENVLTLGAYGDPSDTYNRYSTAGTPLFDIIADDDTDVYFDNIGYEDFSALPEFDEAPVNSTLDTAALDIVGNKFVLNVDVDAVSANQIYDCEVFFGDEELTFDGEKFVSSAIDFNKVADTFDLVLKVGGVAVDTVSNCSIKNILELDESQLAKDILALASALDVYNGGEGFAVEGASEALATAPTCNTKTASRTSAADYIKAATLLINEDINVAFTTKTTDATAIVITADGYDTVEAGVADNYAISADIALANLDAVFTAELKVNDTVVATATYSALDYVCKNYNSANANLAAVCQALYAVYADVNA